MCILKFTSFLKLKYYLKNTCYLMLEKHKRLFKFGDFRCKFLNHVFDTDYQPHFDIIKILHLIV